MPGWSVDQLCRDCYRQVRLFSYSDNLVGCKDSGGCAHALTANEPPLKVEAYDRRRTAQGDDEVMV